MEVNDRFLEKKGQYQGHVHVTLERQLKFLRNIMWNEGLETLTLTGGIEVRRDRGKQKITYLNS